VFRISPGKRTVAETSYQQKSCQNRSGGDATTPFHLFDGYGHFRLGVHLVSARGFRKQGSVDKALNTGLIRRPALRSPASLDRGATSCRLVAGTILSFNGIGIANAGFPAKFTATVFCRPNISASKRAISASKRAVFADERNPWRQFLQSR